MILELIIAIVVGLFTKIVGLFPTAPPPGWATGARDAFAVVLTPLTQLGAWVPGQLLLTVVGAVLSSYTIGFVIKVVRIIASFLTAGGGSAA